MSEHIVLDPDKEFRVSANLCALGIMTKAPEAGKVKTRLTPPLIPEEAAALNICFLRDLAGSISQAYLGSSARGVGVYTPLGSELLYGNILPKDFFLMPQRGHEFGERLIFAAEDLFKVGFESVCLINSDSPTVPPSSFVEAANELAKTGERIVLGPSDDGGYYLIGLKKLHKGLFEEIDWSTERVFDQTMRQASEIGVEVHQLAYGFDVDDRAMIGRLCEELLGPEARSPSNIAPNTRKFLSEIVEREGRDRIWPQTK
jgi:rSAM/selenodomain-associated transferase 1